MPVMLLPTACHAVISAELEVSPKSLERDREDRGAI